MYTFGRILRILLIIAVLALVLSFVVPPAVGWASRQFRATQATNVPAPEPTKALEPTKAPEPTKALEPTKAPEPTKVPAVKPACADTGATWDKLQGKPLTVPTGCEVWISSDPASFEVNGVKGESQTRWTLVATGPVTVTVSIPDQTHTHYHMGVVGSVDINNRDGAPNALIFKDGKFQPRPEKVR